MATKEILLTQGYAALVDLSDYEKLSKHTWRVLKHTKGKGLYAQRSMYKNGSTQTIMMHREILNAPTGIQIDHVNHDTLDNRRSNLRLCSRAQNQHNQLPQGGSSKYKGVYWFKKRKRYIVHICFQKKQFHVGCFAREIDAAKAYDLVAKYFFGEFAYTNFSGRPSTEVVKKVSAFLEKVKYQDGQACTRR